MGPPLGPILAKIFMFDNKDTLPARFGRGSFKSRQDYFFQEQL